MMDPRLPAAGAALLAALALAGCGPYGLKGDRGLPPPSETMAYPNINEVPAPHDGRAAKTTDEQAALRARLLASRPGTPRSPRPFTAEDGLREQRARASRSTVSP